MAKKVEPKNYKTAKIVLIVGASIIALLLVLTLLWFLTSYISFNKYVDVVKERGVDNWTDSSSYSQGFDKTKYQYFIGRPSWMSWSGNLVISMPVEPSSDGFSLFPDGVNAKVSGGKVVEYTADITVTSLQGTSLVTNTYYIKVDKYGNYVSCTNQDEERALEVYNTHRANIKNLVRRINSIWGFID